MSLDSSEKSILFLSEKWSLRRISPNYGGARFFYNALGIKNIDNDIIVNFPAYYTP